MSDEVEIAAKAIRAAVFEVTGDKEIANKVADKLRGDGSFRYAPLSANAYQEAATRTFGSDNAPLLREFLDSNAVLDPGGLLLAAFGIAGESGEVVDNLKKVIFHAHPYNETKLKGELGDVAWYLARACSAIGCTLEEVFEQNISKLRERYPDGFSYERSVNR